MSNFLRMAKILKNYGFKIIKDKKIQPNIMISSPEELVTIEGKQCVKKKVIRAVHHCPNQTMFAALTLMDLFDEDKSFLLTWTPDSAKPFEYQGGLGENWIEVIAG